MGFIILSSIVSSFFGLLSTSNSNRHQPAVVKTAPKPVKKKEYKDYIKFYTLDRNGSSLLFYLAERNYEREDDDKDGFYIVFYDYIENKIIKEEQITSKNEGSRSVKFTHSYLPAIQKDIILVDERKIYELDFKNLSFSDISVSLLADYPEFSSGIASAKFIYHSRGEGLTIISNMGKEFYFVPSFKKLYTKDAFYDAASTGMRNISPNAINKTYYLFSSRSTDFPDEQIELLKIIYKYNNGGPEDKETSPRWRKQYGYSGIIYSNTPYKKILVDKDRGRVVSCDNITPGRIYFSAEVLNQEDDNKLLISFKPTISPEEKTQIQLIDLNTKEPIWTATTEEKLTNKETVKFKNNYIIPLRSDNLLKLDLQNGAAETITITTKREYK